jgi:arylsulfatase A-like enzyme
MVPGRIAAVPPPLPSPYGTRPHGARHGGGRGRGTALRSGVRFWPIVAALAVASTLASAASAATGNILLLIADDFGLDMASFYPPPARVESTPPAPRLPSLGRLARQGVTFSDAWATPWCSPTRATILTGRYGFRTGIGRPKTAGLPELAQAEVTLPEVIGAQAPQYVLAHVGKWHLSSGIRDPNRQGWTHYAGPEPRLGRINNYSRWTKVVDGKATTSTTYATTDTVDETLGVIEEARRADRPYFVWAAFNAPHNPFHKPPNALHSRDYLPASGAPDRSYYEAMVEALDTEIGRLLRSVDLATTTVIFLGDNGTPNGVVAAPYERAKAKGTVYQGGVGVPLLVAGRGVRGGNREARVLVNTTDLFPTILELAGIDPESALPRGVKTDGVSLAPYLANRVHPWPRRWAFAEEFTSSYRTEWERAIRDRQYGLIERHDGTREFYNLVADPLQKVDLLDRTLTDTQRRRLEALDRQLDRIIASR